MFCLPFVGANENLTTVCDRCYHRGEGFQMNCDGKKVWKNERKPHAFLGRFQYGCRRAIRTIYTSSRKSDCGLSVCFSPQLLKL